jgi:hypothetical protein
VFIFTRFHFWTWLFGLKAEALVGRAFLRGADRWITKTPPGWPGRSFVFMSDKKTGKKKALEVNYLSSS